MLKILTKTILTITIILSSSSQLIGQQLRGMAYNHAITSTIADNKNISEKSSVGIIEFDSTFFEDFSDYRDEIFPRNDFWEDNSVYINSTYADSMISLGVATLDAYDQFGYPYYSASKPNTSADTLTSHPFKFRETLPNSLFFSFFYQAGGLGDLPEGDSTDSPGVLAKDTLIVEFYDPEDSIWVSVFKTLDNSTPHQFKQVILQVPDSLIVDSLQFRFRNYVSLPNFPQGSDLGKYGNADQWHIDYIQLRANTDSLEMSRLKDIAITKPLTPTLKEYTAVPWSHFTLAQSSIEKNLYPISVKNFYANGDDSVKFQRNYVSYNLDTGEELLRKKYSNPIFSNSYFSQEDYYRTGFKYDDATSIGRLKVVSYIEPTDLVQPQKNDTAIRIETYYDHYAYDDGTAEYGFGINGEQEEQSRIAIRYRVFRRSNNPDTLKAVLIYFAKAIDSTTADYSYSIAIRKNKGAIPSTDTLYTSDELYPDYSVGINQFTRIEIDPPVAISDTFFIVINQLSGYLNIGYDINHDNLHHLFNYVNHTWTKSYTVPGGSLMVRPSFGNQSIIPFNTEDLKARDEFSVFPNPATDRIQFTLPSGETGLYGVQVYNVLGKLEVSTKTDEHSISVSNLKPGVYFIVVSGPDGLTRHTAKFIKE